MQLQEQVTALEAEKKHYINILENANAEKIALDQMYVSSLKEVLNHKKEIILLNAKINNLNSINENLIKEKESLNLVIEDLKFKKETTIEI